MNEPATSGHRQLLVVLTTLRPYLNHVVVIGGWVPALYRAYGGLEWRGRLSYTSEVDVLAVPPIPVEGGRTLDDVLRAAGFLPGLRDETSAVWSQQGADGALIEFLCPHEGVLRDLGGTQVLGGHGQVGAIRLADSGILRRHTRTIVVPVRIGRVREMLQIKVPALGAYVVNKGITYPAPRALEEADNPKRAKDVLYLRDVASAGPAVTALVEADLRAMLRADAPTRLTVARARNNLRIARSESLRPEAVHAAAVMLSERDRIDQAAASADLAGHLTDLVELLELVLRGADRSRGA